VLAGLWCLAVMPTVLGWQRCALAVLFRIPCPGCGMTRAIELLALGRFGASIRMHPLALPVLVVGAVFVSSTVWTTFRLGSPLRLLESRYARAALACLVVVYAALFALWAVRWLGYWGGPVPV